ncbi:hypothetical protein [Limnohabitans sp. 2KL-3]|uniref:hypothetical protein n=1 Tax=Limnohabitans sp. 2KL-3 TaxID=1100700 RepID=UPI000B336C2D|nr:hypothetical protein [Limnohabitans sp. 2KL-3]
MNTTVNRLPSNSIGIQTFTPTAKAALDQSAPTVEVAKLPGVTSLTQAESRVEAAASGSSLLSASSHRLPSSSAIQNPSSRLASIGEEATAYKAILNGSDFSAGLNLLSAPGLSIDTAGAAWTTSKVGPDGKQQSEFNYAKAAEVTGGISTGVHSALRALGAAATAAKAANVAATGAATGIGTALDASWGITGVVGTAKETVQLGLLLAQDAAAHSDRKEFEGLVRDFDPASGKFRTGPNQSLEENPKALERMEALVNKSGADRTQSRLQVAGDRFAKIKDVSVGTVAVVSSAISLAGGTVPGLGVVTASAYAAGAIWKSGNNIVALNNATLAGNNAKGDEVLESITEHIKQERTVQSRKNLMTATLNTASLAAQVAALGTGVGAPITAAIGAASTASTLAIIAYDGIHNRKLNKDREKFGSAEAWTAAKAQQGTQLKETLTRPENRGLAERALIDRLRNGTDEQKARAVQYLSNFGLTNQKITQLRLTSDPEKALGQLQKALYSENVKISWAGFKAGSGESFLRITGLHALSGFIKGKLEARREKAQLEKSYPNLGHKAGAWAAAALSPRSTPLISGARQTERLAETKLRSEPVRLAATFPLHLGTQAFTLPSPKDERRLDKAY